MRLRVAKKVLRKRRWDSGYTDTDATLLRAVSRNHGWWWRRGRFNDLTPGWRTGRLDPSMPCSPWEAPF